MNYVQLKAEIDDDPLGRGYSEMDDQEIVDSLNTVDRDQNVTSMTGSEIINEVNTAEWAALTDAQRQTVWDIVHLGTINPFGVEKNLLIGVFGSGSNTIAALGIARVTAVSRATELGLSQIKAGTIAHARTV